MKGQVSSGSLLTMFLETYCRWKRVNYTLTESIFEQFDFFPVGVRAKCQGGASI